MADDLCMPNLPAEVLCHIASLLDHPRDAASCVAASAALAYASPLDVATRYYRGQSEAALAAGLPLDIARVLFERWGMTPECRHIPAAAVGGRADVVRWVCCHTEGSASSIPSWTTVRAPTSVRQCTYVPRPDPVKYGPRECAPFDPTIGSGSSLPGSPLLMQSTQQEAATVSDDDGSLLSLGSDDGHVYGRRMQRHTPDARAASDRSTGDKSRPGQRRRRQSASTLDSGSEDDDNEPLQVLRLERRMEDTSITADCVSNGGTRPTGRRRRQSAPILDSSSSSSSDGEHKASARRRVPPSTFRTNDSGTCGVSSILSGAGALRLSIQADSGEHARADPGTPDTSSEPSSPFGTPRSWHVRRRPSPKPPGRSTRTIRVNGDHETARCLFKAVSEAARFGHIDVLRHLTVSCPLTETPSALLGEHVIIEAARCGTLATVAYAHDRWSQPHSVGSKYKCRCSKQIAEAALAAGQRDLLRWMRTVGCAAFPCDMASLARAVTDGNDALVDAITDALVPVGCHVRTGAVRQFDGWADPRVLREAAREGHARALAIAHARGFAPFTAALLADAAAGGHLDILRWAAGESVPCVEPCFAPLERLPWDDPMVAWHAAGQLAPAIGVLDWLAARPETRCHFDVLMARTLLAQDRSDVVLWMHDRGLVLASSWNSLEVAIQAGVDCIEALIDRGATCSPRAMAVALMASGSDTRLIALLCRRYGHADLRDAVRLYVHAADTEAIRWVHDNVPEVSVAHILQADRACPFIPTRREPVYQQDDRSWGTSE